MLQSTSLFWWCIIIELSELQSIKVKQREGENNLMLVGLESFNSRLGTQVSTMRPPVSPLISAPLTLLMVMVMYIYFLLQQLITVSVARCTKCLIWCLCYTYVSRFEIRGNLEQKIIFWKSSVKASKINFKIIKTDNLRPSHGCLKFTKLTVIHCL